MKYSSKNCVDGERITLCSAAHARLNAIDRTKTADSGHVSAGTHC
jgi:hypothetical protein